RRPGTPAQPPTPVSTFPSSLSLFNLPSVFPSSPHEQALSLLQAENQHLHTKLNELSAAAAVPSAVATAPRSPEPRLPHPKVYDGTLGNCRGFLLQCQNVFALKPLCYDTEHKKISYVVGLLQGRALAWAEAEGSQRPWSTRSLNDFLTLFRAVFDLPDHAGNVAQRLLALSQGTRSVADYAVEFRILAAETGWDEPALRGIFIRGLAERLKDELAARDEPSTLDALVSLAVRLDNCLRERRREKHATSSSRPAPPAPPPQRLRSSTAPGGERGSSPNPCEPMQLGRARLTLEERESRVREGRCIYCGAPGHFMSACPVRPKGPGSPLVPRHAGSCFSPVLISH
uniref:CCHC-type domain-containing protein n=1 Tax=Lates calcarifer TaxID=8187 RepID=A0A4W6F130_LATCA